MKNERKRKRKKKRQTAPPWDMLNPAQELASLKTRHLHFGWWALLVFLSLGITLEILHGFKVGEYLNVSNATRRLMWTLAHAHGALLGLVNLLFCLTLTHLPNWRPIKRRYASLLLLVGSILLPGGFFLAGVFIYAGDPGLGIILVPLGALALWFAVFLTARAASAASTGLPPEETDAEPSAVPSES